MAIHNKHPGFSKEDILRLRRMYMDEELTMLEISKREKCGLKSLRRTFIENGIKKEQTFLSDKKDFKYIPKEKFNGWTECFLVEAL